MARFNLEDYETVADRLVKFWADYPEGRIYTEIVNDLSFQKNEQFVVRAFVYKKAEDTVAWATGLAEEHFGTQGPNQTSPIENCETSAIGRALANAGYATKSDKRPSREEMEKVQRGSVPNGSDAVAAIKENRTTTPKPQPAGPKPKTTVEGDPRWEMIKAAHDADPSNEFIKNLYDTGKKWGKLTSKQLDTGCTSANRILDAGKQGGGIKSVVEAFEGATYEGKSTEPF